MRFGAPTYRHVYLGYPLTLVQGQVDQLEDRYLGMVEASGSNPDLSILRLLCREFLGFYISGFLFMIMMRLL